MTMEVPAYDIHRPAQETARGERDGSSAGRDLARPALDAEMYELMWRDVEAGESPALLATQTAEGIPELRERSTKFLANDEDLSLGGRVEFEELSVPGYEGAPTSRC